MCRQLAQDFTFRVALQMLAAHPYHPRLQAPLALLPASPLRNSTSRPAMAAAPAALAARPAPPQLAAMAPTSSLADVTLRMAQIKGRLQGQTAAYDLDLYHPDSCAMPDLKRFDRGASIAQGGFGRLSHVTLLNVTEGPTQVVLKIRLCLLTCRVLARVLARCMLPATCTCCNESA